MQLIWTMFAVASFDSRLILDAACKTALRLPTHSSKAYILYSQMVVEAAWGSWAGLGLDSSVAEAA